MGFLSNKWVLQRVLGWEDELSSATVFVGLVTFQLTLVGVGALAVFGKLRLPGKADLALMSVAVFATLALAEVGARMMVPGPQFFEQIIGESSRHPARLSDANTTRIFTIRGLYEGADQAVLRGSEHGLIEPVSEAEAEFNILFVGGSTTEARYVPEDDRWVALLNVPGEIATFNAGVSGGNTADAYFNYLFLIEEQGFEFDLVILMTQVNDWSWMFALRPYGGSLRVDGYRDYLSAWYLDRRDTGFVATLRRQARLVEAAARAATALDQTVFSSLLSNEQSAESQVVIAYRESRQNVLDAYEADTAPLNECDMLRENLADYEQITTSNLRAFNDKVKEAGAHLLVMSEAHSYGAPEGSFYEDFRVPRRCAENLLSHEGSAAFSDKLGQSYLRAASKAGTLIYDLAGEMEPFMSGADGGRYMYDEVHYTVDGSREVARLVAPVMRQILAER